MTQYISTENKPKTNTCVVVVVGNIVDVVGGAVVDVGIVVVVAVPRNYEEDESGVCSFLTQKIF